MECCGFTSVGRHRSNNEDQFLIADICKSMRVHRTSLALDHETRMFGETQAKLLLVADGMGGHEAGERASQLVTDEIVDYILNRLTWFMADAYESEEEFEEQLKYALISCQNRINREVAEVPQYVGMGTTLTLAYISWPMLFLVHVGDSRCYCLRDGMLEQLTRDHTLARLAAESHTATLDMPYGDGTQSMSDDESESATETGYMSNVLWNVIGGGSANRPDPDTKSFELRKGDTILLCSDGLSNMLSRDEIKDILSQNITTEAICSQLVDAANEAGGKDNITVVVSRFLDKTVEESQLEQVVLPLEEALADTVDIDKSK